MGRRYKRQQIEGEDGIMEKMKALFAELTFEHLDENQMEIPWKLEGLQERLGVVGDLRRQVGGAVERLAAGASEGPSEHRQEEAGSLDKLKKENPKVYLEP